MKLKEIILDFTSLLDVIMIILFWFILNYHNQTVEIQSQAEAAMAEASDIASEAEQQMQENEREMSEWREEASAQMRKWEKEAAEKMEMLENADKEAADNLKAILDFQEGAGIEIDLYVENQEKWNIRIKSGDNIIGVISNDDGFDIMKSDSAIGIAEKMTEIFDSAGLDTEDTVIGTYLYDGDSEISYYPINTVSEAISELRKSYGHFYCLEINKTD